MGMPLSELFAVYRFPIVPSEQQFDANDDLIERLGKTAREDVSDDDLSYYFDDLAFVDLDPDLFAHLFPVCLAYWRKTLHSGEPCETGVMDFHFALAIGDVLEKMLSESQRDAVSSFFAEAMLERLRTHPSGLGESPWCAILPWVQRLNSLAVLRLESYQSVWNQWWSVPGEGEARGVLKFLACILGHFPDIRRSAQADSLSDPVTDFAENDTATSFKSLPENIEALRSILTPERALRATQNAVTILQGAEDAARATEIGKQIMTSEWLPIVLGEFLQTLENFSEERDD